MHSSFRSGFRFSRAVSLSWRKRLWRNKPTAVFTDLPDNHKRVIKRFPLPVYSESEVS